MDEVKPKHIAPKERRYKWEELEVNQGYPCKHASTQYSARDYMERLAKKEDRPDYLGWEFGSRRDENGVLHIVRTA